MKQLVCIIFLTCINSVLFSQDIDELILLNNELQKSNAKINKRVESLENQVSKGKITQRELKDLSIDYLKTLGENIDLMGKVNQLITKSLNLKDDIDNLEVKVENLSSTIIGLETKVKDISPKFDEQKLKDFINSLSITLSGKMKKDKEFSREDLMTGKIKASIIRSLEILILLDGNFIDENKKYEFTPLVKLEPKEKTNYSGKIYTITDDNVYKGDNGTNYKITIPLKKGLKSGAYTIEIFIGKEKVIIIPFYLK